MTVLLLLLRATVVIAIALVVARALRRRSATVRADLWRATFVALALLPLATVFLPALPWLPALNADPATPVSPEAGDPTAGLHDVLISDSHEPGSEVVRTATGDPASQVRKQAEISTSPTIAVPSLPFDWIDNLLLLWMGGVLWQVLRLGSGLRRAAAMARSAEHMQSDGRVEIVTSPDASSAFVWDPRPFARPIVVLPRTETDNATWRTAVLAHELHHVERGDGAFLPLATLIAAFYWPTPLARVALRRLRLEIERAADDAVVRAGVRPTDYASGLVSLATSPAPVPVPTMAARGTVTRRVEALLDARVDRGTTTRQARSGALLFALLLAAPIATMTSAVAVQEVDPSSEASVDTGEMRRQMRERALVALVALQDEETGAWRGDVGFKLNRDWRITGKDVPHVGVTGLAVEALIAGGTRFDDSTRGRSLKRAVDFLLECQDDDGYIHENGSRMRSHAHALRGLAAVLIVESAPRLESAVTRAMDFSMEARGSETGGWRFVPHSETTDIIETAFQFDALKFAAHSRALAIARAGQTVTKPAGQSFYDATRATDYAARLRVVEAGEALYGGYRFQSSKHARITVNTSVAGLVLHSASEIPAPSRLDQATASMILTHRDWRAASLEDSGEHFLTWDAELLAMRAFADTDGSIHRIDAGEVRLVAAWREGTLEWLTGLQLPGGGWKCTTGPGDSYSTAVGCLLLASR